MSQQGVIVGCDQNIEWLLPWWWEHYSKHNSYPVSFADFGMSQKALSWCQQKGEVLSLPPCEVKIFTEQELSVSEKKRLEERYGEGIWFFRKAWFKKPFALLHSPFSIGIWLDLDCQVNGCIEPIFNSLCFGADIGLVKEPNIIQELDQKGHYLLPEEVHYNSGVIVFRRNACILHQWVEEVVLNNKEHAGDQQALSRAIYKYKPQMIELASEFNWLGLLGSNPNALIYHHCAGGGKLEILKQILGEKKVEEMLKQSSN